MTEKTNQWIPEIVYEAPEDDDGAIQGLPMIHVPEGEVMPSFLMFFEMRNTGRFELLDDGKAMPVVDQELYQFGSMNVLRDNLPVDVYDQVRQALGLAPLAEAVAAGKALTERVRKNVEETVEEEEA